jgi:hypothetical protein
MRGFMRRRLVVACLGILAIAMLAVSFMWIQWFADRPSFVGPKLNRDSATTSASFTSAHQSGQRAQKLPSALSSLQSPDPPAPKAMQASADAADEAAQAAADIAERQ